MLSNLLYRIVYIYVKAGLHLFYKKIEVTGKEHIPKEGVILFVANHQNAMMDPILVGTHNPRVLYFLARASAFKNKIAAKLLNAIHAIAIYRVRDGVNSKKLNEAVFQKCNDLLNKNKSILIFPEGSHSILRRVRSLRAGFTRITFDFLEKNPNKPFYIVPVGLNFSNTINYAKEVKIVYGEKVEASKFYDPENVNRSRGDLINEVHKKLKEITVHIEDNEHYDAWIDHLSEEEFLTPKETNLKLQTKEINKVKARSKKRKQNTVFYYIMMVNSIFPMLFWWWLKPKVKAVEFTSTAKFSVGATLFPLFYFLQSVIIYNFLGWQLTLGYVIFSFVVVLLSTKLR